jgi:hypothetical protein
LAGQTLVITNLAGDVLAPPQMLSYSLLAPPVGAGINPASGVFSWRPTIAQGGTTNRLTVTVSNSGLPNLDAMQGFAVTVLRPRQPVFANYFVSNGLFVSGVAGDAGPDYSLLCSTNLLNWAVVFATNQPAMPFQFAVPSAGAPEYYRIRLGP